jgi:hypothetical protein
MTTVDGLPILSLSAAIDRLREALPITGALPVPTLIPLPIPIFHPPIITTITRGGTTIGVVITPFGQPAPTAANVKLNGGTLWVEATLFGAAFSSTPGFAGIPFSAGTMNVTGSVTFSAGSIVLDAAATLSFDVTSAIAPATAPPGDPIGPDFIAGKLDPFPHAAVTLAPTGASIELTGTGSATL